MGKIFVGQTALKFEVLTYTDLTGATAQFIKYKKPDESTGSFTATITDAKGGILEYTVTAVEELDQAGEWTLWGHATFPSGVVPGEAVKLEIFNEGEV